MSPGSARQPGCICDAMSAARRWRDRAITDWCKRVERPRLIVVDVLSKFRPTVAMRRIYASRL